MHALCAKFFSNDSRFDDIGLSAKATVFTWDGSAVLAVFNEECLPIAHGLALDAIARLGLLVFIISDKRAHFFSKSVVFFAVR
tara:strand:+ start:74 stop:322 length:249 start_codon:yes stop_codon:yes gene_type:complete